MVAAPQCKQEDVRVTEHPATHDSEHMHARGEGSSVFEDMPYALRLEDVHALACIVLNTHCTKARDDGGQQHRRQRVLPVSDGVRSDDSIHVVQLDEVERGSLTLWQICCSTRNQHVRDATAHNQDPGE